MHCSLEFLIFSDNLTCVQHLFKTSSVFRGGGSCGHAPPLERPPYNCVVTMARVPLTKILAMPLFKTNIKTMQITANVFFLYTKIATTS